MPERPCLYNWWLLNYKLSLFSLSNALFHNSIVRTISVRVNESVRENSVNLTQDCQSQQLQPSCEQNFVNPLIVSEGTLSYSGG